MSRLPLKLLISMYLFLQCEVTIGSITLNQVNEIEVRSSWRDLTDTATITLPRNLNYRLERLDQVIKRDDPVTIKVGFNGNLTTEFEGYVKEVEPNTPVKIYCEDEMLKLKRGHYTKVWKKLKLEEIIKEIAPGYKYEIEDATLTYLAKNKSAAEVLLDLREYGVFTYFRKINGQLTLYSGFPYSFNFSEHTYHMQKNIRENDLKFRMAIDPSDPSSSIRIQVKAIANLPNGKKTIEYFPSEDKVSGAEIITMNYSELSSDEKTRKKLLLQYAEAEFKKYNVDGYRGSITGFAIPVVRHGDQVKIIDARYPEREGKYLVDRTTVQFGEVYLKRRVELGPKVSV